MTSCDPDTADYFLFKRQLVGEFCIANHLVSPTLNAGRKKIGMQAEVVNRKRAFLRVKELHFHKIGRPFKLIIRCKSPMAKEAVSHLDQFI